jgi:ABC-2 type transport system permease protein
MRQILYMMSKEFKQIFRTREMVAIIFFLPIIQMAILGFAITNEVKSIKLIISDHDNSFASRVLIRSFQHTERFQVIGYEKSNSKINDAIHNWDAQMAIVIPKDFGKDLFRNVKPEIQIIIDGIDGNTAGIALGYSQGIINRFILNHLKQPENIKAVGGFQSAGMEERMWYNLNLNSAQYMVPGLVVVLLTVISMMLSAMSLVREKEIGTLEQLMVTPLKKYQLLLGKLLPFLILTFVEMIIIINAAQIIFSIKFVGSQPLLVGLASLYLFTTLGLGIFISTITSTQQQAMFLAWFFMVFMLLMSGFLIPIENMPVILQKFTYLNPMRYFIYITRDIFQKGSNVEYLKIDIFPMTIYGILIFWGSVLKFHKRID